MVTRNQIVNGIVKFIESDMSAASGNGTSKFIVSLAKNALKKHPEIVDSVMENSLIKSVIPSESGSYDIAPLTQMLKDTMTETGSIPLKLPKIPLLLPDGDEIRLNATDIDKISGYINANTVTTGA